MEHKLLIFVIAFATCLALSHGAECCKAYNDFEGNHHPAQVCEKYCCFDVSISTFTEGALESCCSDSIRRVPAYLRDDECIDWIKEHIWVPIVGSIFGLIILIGICTCCCCCGCCSCCRKSTPGVVVAGGPAHTVVMSSQQTMQTNNPVHVGYNQ